MTSILKNSIHTETPEQREKQVKADHEVTWTNVRSLRWAPLTFKTSSQRSSESQRSVGLSNLLPYFPWQ